MRPRVVGASWTPLLAAALATLAGGCTDSNAPDRMPATSRPDAAAAAARAPAPRGIDAEFVRLAKQIPGFAGMYYDQAGKLNVQVARQGGIAARGADVMGRLRSVGGSAVQRRLRTGGAVMREAKYDFGQLAGWKSRLGRVFQVKGVVYTDIDEAANRLRIAIQPGASQRDVERVVSQAGIPREAVLISRMSPIRAAKSVQGQFRPAPGGVQISFPLPDQPGFLGVCTLGFNAQLTSQPGPLFFVTTSHCSGHQGGNTLTPYFQPLPPRSNASAARIAVEFKDPAYGDPGGLCFEGFRCRLSDALLAKYLSPEQNGRFGKIARTTFALTRIGSLLIDEAHPRWTVITEFEFPFLGEIVHKMGRTTGWTRGPTVATCVDTGQNGTDIVILCQDFVLAGYNFGDSGSPAFERESDDPSNGNIALVGLTWGFGTDQFGAPIFVLSPMENIEFELGQLTTAVR